MRERKWVWCRKCKRENQQSRCKYDDLRKLYGIMAARDECDGIWQQEMQRTVG